jgi:hypothetical protein
MEIPAIPSGKKDANGNELWIPMEKGLGWWSKTYKVSCDKLPRKTNLRLLFALVSTHPCPPPQQNLWCDIAPMHPPNMVAINGDFRVFMRVEKIKYESHDIKDFGYHLYHDPKFEDIDDNFDSGSFVTEFFVLNVLRFQHP